jgi:hypothetical protein
VNQDRESFNLHRAWIAVQGICPLAENALFRAMEWRGAMRNAMQYSIAGHPLVERVELHDGQRGNVYPATGISILPNKVVSGDWQVVGLPVV